MPAKESDRAIKPLILILLLFIVQMAACTNTVKPVNPYDWVRNNPQVSFTAAYGDSVNKYQATGIIQTYEGGYAIAGQVAENRTNTMNYKTNYRKTAGSSDGWIIKTDAQGKEIWNRPIVGRASDSISSFLAEDDGGFVLAGWTDTGSSQSDGWLVKVNATGDQVWARSFPCADIDLISSVKKCPDGGYILAGWATFVDDRYQDAWLLKTSGEGNPIWSRNYGNSKSDIVKSVEIGKDGGFLLAGQSINPVNNSYDGWVLKTDSHGEQVWQVFLGGSGEDCFYSIKNTIDGEIILAGSTFASSAADADGWLVKLDQNGRKLFERTFNTTIGDRFNDIQATTDGGYIVAGHNGTRDSSNFPVIEDAWVLKTDARGNEIWSATFGGKRPDSFTSVIQTRDGGYALSGYACSTSTAEPVAWLVKLNPDPRQ